MKREFLCKVIICRLETEYFSSSGSINVGFNVPKVKCFVGTDCSRYVQGAVAFPPSQYCHSLRFDSATWQSEKREKRPMHLSFVHFLGFCLEVLPEPAEEPRAEAHFLPYESVLRIWVQTNNAQLLLRKVPSPYSTSLFCVGPSWGNRRVGEEEWNKWKKPRSRMNAVNLQFRCSSTKLEIDFTAQEQTGQPFSLTQLNYLN